MSYIKNILIAIDQVGNAIAGGNPDATISGRIGYFANHSVTVIRWYWIILQCIVDATFWPLDGPNHCHNSYHKDENENYVAVHSTLIAFILSFIIISTCIPLMPVLYLLHALGFIKNKNSEKEV